MRYITVLVLFMAMGANVAWARRAKEDSALTKSIEGLYHKEAAQRVEKKIEKEEKDDLMQSITLKKIKEQMDKEHAESANEVKKALSERDKAEAELSMYEQELLDRTEMELRMSELRRLEKEIFKN